MKIKSLHSAGGQILEQVKKSFNSNPDNQAIKCYKCKLTVTRTECKINMQLRPESIERNEAKYSSN